MQLEFELKSPVFKPCVHYCVLQFAPNVMRTPSDPHKLALTVVSWCLEEPLAFLPHCLRAMRPV